MTKIEFAFEKAVNFLEKQQITQDNNSLTSRIFQDCDDDTPSVDDDSSSIEYGRGRFYAKQRNRPFFCLRFD